MTAVARRLCRTVAVSVATVAAVAGCSSTQTPDATSSSGAVNGPIAIKAGDKTCAVAAVELSAGRHVFEVSNTSSQITEVYVYAAGDRIMGEVENVGPSTKRTLIVDLPAGSYEVACKPGMVGNGIRATLTVRGERASSDD